MAPQPQPRLNPPAVAEAGRLSERLGALSGGLIGLALAAGLWGPDTLALLQARDPLYLLSVIPAALGSVVVCALAGWRAARTARPVLAALLWLVTAALVMFAAGHLPFEAATLLAWLADRRFWGLPIYPYDATAQARLVVGSLLPGLVLLVLGLAQDYRVEGIQGALDARRLSPRAWLLLLLPLPFVFGAGVSADNIVNRPLVEPLIQVAQIILASREYTGDLDALSRQTGLNDSALLDVRSELAGPFRLMLGEADLGGDQTVVVVANFDSGAWINCRMLVDRVSFCEDAQTTYAASLQTLLAGQDLSQCQACQVQAGADWQAWLRARGPRLGSPQLTRLGQQGRYVLLRAANPASGYAIECLFQGNRVINLEWCKDE